MNDHFWWLNKIISICVRKEKENVSHDMEKQNKAKSKLTTKYNTFVGNTTKI